MSNLTLQQLNKHQLRANVIDMSHIDVTTVGKSLITKVIAGQGLMMTNYTGVDVGTGEVTLQLDSSLASLANLSGIGFLTRLADESIAARSLLVSSNLTITDSIGASNNPVIDLSNTGVVAGTYKYVTTDIKGRITNGYKYLQTWVANEILVDSGDHIHYTISNLPVNGTDMLFVSGVKQIPGSDRDYTISGNNVTFTTPNLPIDVVTACYFWNENNIDIQDIKVETLTPFDSSLKRYRLSYLPQINSQVVFANGLLQRIGSDYDYTMEGQDVVFINTMDSNDTISVMYWR
jgi:hypothetical protein